jgi:hypothetical protein
MCLEYVHTAALGAYKYSWGFVCMLYGCSQGVVFNVVILELNQLSNRRNTRLQHISQECYYGHYNQYKMQTSNLFFSIGFVVY